MMVPCHNPDGMDMIVDHYNKYKGTKYEGSSMPGVYHKYVGHDNNRDFVSLSQSDTRAIAAIYNKDWFPQVMVEKHQMGSSGVRYFVPPPHDPIAENIDAGIWNWIGVFGSGMMKDMTRDGLKGIAQNYLFDDYWPGGWWRLGDLVVPLAQPIRSFIKEMLEKQVYPIRHYTPNGEIMKPYDITSWSLPLHNGVDVKEVTVYNPELPKAWKQINGEYDLKKGLMTEFWGLALPVERNESFKVAFYALSLGLPVERLISPLIHQGKTISTGSFIIYGLSGKDKLDRLYNEMSVDPVYLEEKPVYLAEKFNMPRVALIETNMHDMDAGWTRFLFDTFHLPFTVVKPGDFEKTDFTTGFDVVVFPSNNKDILKEGKYKSDGDDYYISDYPPEFTKGMGEKGFNNLIKYLDNGGLIVSWGSSTDLFSGTLKIKRSDTETEEFQLPYSNISKKLEGLYVPGSFVKIELKEDHPITLGMPPESGVFYRGNPVFSTSMPNFDMDRRVIGRFPEKDILLSGYIEKEELLSEKSCLVWLKKGKGQLVLFAFNPQFRASTAADYKLLFNALLLDRLQ